VTTNPTTTCPTGGTFNPTTGKCEAQPTCSQSQGTFNPATGKCEVKPNACPTNTTFNPTTGNCEEFLGSPGATPIEGACPSITHALFVPAYLQVLPDGSGYYGCFTHTPKAYSSEAPCPSGYTGSGVYGCYAPATCPSGTSLPQQSTTCIAPACPTNTTYNPTTGNCETTTPTECPAGYTLNSGVCHAPQQVSCPSGFNLINNDTTCLQQTEPTCPSSSTFNPSTKLCEAPYPTPPRGPPSTPPGQAPSSSSSGQAPGSAPTSS
jgi:hypothetical protein